MPRYLIKRDTWISHQGKLAKAGETVDIDWPKHCEPKTLGDNMELVDDKPKGKSQKSESDPLA